MFVALLHPCFFFITHISPFPQFIYLFPSSQVEKHGPCLTLFMTPKVMKSPPPATYSKAKHTRQTPSPSPRHTHSLTHNQHKIIIDSSTTPNKTPCHTRPERNTITPPPRQI
ncbi:hypothetical protein B0T19DRAFT_418491 [Cercophora scortea]|uniref:Uncharacterized protein n=1 Tax=Cercophora scortea TaxID=314031 RepID=A0AAE0IZ45_9PEZI|nr:hypothetical protein B0T19DRAFT_418491 [Cercophora scortea]